MKRQLLFAAALLASVLGMKAQTNIIKDWDGGTPSTGKPDTFGWKSSRSDRTWGNENAGSGIRFTTTYPNSNDTKYKLEDGSEYKYVANSDPSSKILWIRYDNNKPETYTYTFKGLEAGQAYVFSGLVGWHNNEKDVTFTIKIKGDQGTEEYATIQVEPKDKRVLYAVSEKFTIPEDDASTEFSLEFTGTYTYANYDDCMEALSALAIYSEEDDAKKGLDDAKKQLSDVINAVKSITTSKANVGKDAFQIPETALTTLETALTEAQEYTTAEDIEDIKQATTKLQKAQEDYTNAELNAPTEGVLYNIINVSNGYQHAGKAITFKSAEGSDVDSNHNQISMGWTEFPGSIYPQGILFEAVPDETNTYYLSYTRADDTTIYIASAAGVKTGTSEYIRSTTDKEEALKIKVSVLLDKEEVWYIYNTECIGDKNKQGGVMRIGGNGSDNSGLFTGEFNTYKYYDMQITPAKEYTAEVEIAGGKYSTVIVPFDTEIDAEVYSVSEENVEGNVLKLQPVEGGIKANTPYIVYAEKAIENLSGIGAAYTDTQTFTAGLLTGTYATNQKVAKGKYVLQTNDENEQGFYVVNDDNFSHTQYRAYLTKPEGGDVKAAYYFDFAGDATAIEAVPEVAEGAEKVFYNLAGQRVANPTKGIYIVNGQKVLVK